VTGALCAPAPERNKGPILDVLRRVLPRQGVVLEIASGTGQHVVHFAAGLPDLTWQPSDADAQARASIAAWRADANLPNVLPPLDLDVRCEPWPVQRADALVCINMIHIAPWAAAVHLVEGARRILPPGAPLVLYGPYRRDGRHTAPSNAAFDADLRRRNPDWGVRDLEAVAALAAENAFAFDEAVEMPANNLTVVFRRNEA
jgi:SAM-dependent methyltransferase